MTTRVRRLVGAAGAIALVVLTIAVARPVEAASATVVCAPSFGSLVLTVGETLTLSAASGCTLEDTAVTGSSVESVDLGVFEAVAAGTSTVTAYAGNSFGSYTNVWTVKVKAPGPSPTITPTPTPTPTATGTAAPPPSASATPSGPTAGTPPPAQLSAAQPIGPRANQDLRPGDVRIAALDSGRLAFVDTKGHPLQLLSISGDREAVSIVDRGMNYTWQPANWQRLGYGDLCWGYAGYQSQDVTALFLPVATPPFTTVPADWRLSAAIVSTQRGNTVFTDPAPGQIVTGGGRVIRALTLCARASAPEVTEQQTRALRVPAKPGGGGGGGNSVANNPLNGVSNGCKNAGPQERNPHCVQAPAHTTFPVFTGSYGGTTSTPGGTGTPASTPSPAATPSTSATPTSSAGPGDPRVPVCRATGKPGAPYRLEIVPLSSLERTGPNILFPTTGWTDILPPSPGVPGGQNWPAGARLLYGSTPKCQLPASVATPQPSATTTPAPTPTITLTPLPQPTVSGTAPGPSQVPGPTITGYGPAIVVTPVPQPTFGGFSPVTPWPPLYPVPALPQLVPTVIYAIPPSPPPRPTPTPRPTAPPVPSPTPSATYATPSLPAPTPSATATASPTASPAVTATGTATPTAGVPTPTATYPIPPSPTPYVWPTPRPSTYPTPYPTPSKLPQQPTLVVPVLAPSLPFAPLVSVAVPKPMGPSPSPVASSPTASPTPTASASASASPSASASGTTSAGASAPPSSPPASIAASPTLPLGTPTPAATRQPVPGTVTFVLTNGPDTVFVTRPVEQLVSLVQRTPGGATTDTGGATTDTGTPALAATGADQGSALLLGTGLLAVGLLLTPLLRDRRRRALRITLVAGVSAAGMVLCSGVAWSSVAQDRAYTSAQDAAARTWGDSIARLSFSRPGEERALVSDAPVYVFGDIQESTLTRGPGWYPTTSPLGSQGNTAIAGHRSGWGAPFAQLDELRVGDEITVGLPSGQKRVYTVTRSQLVSPDAAWVLGPDPLGTGEATLTLTTCDPPGENTSRLIVFATLTDVRPAHA